MGCTMHAGTRNHFCKCSLRCKCAHKHTALATDKAPPGLLRLMYRKALKLRCGAPVKSSFRPTYCGVTLILLCQNDPHRKQCPMEGVRESLFTLNK